MKQRLLFVVQLLFIGIQASLYNFHARAVTPLRVEGLVAATFTPFDKNFKVDASIVPEQAAGMNNWSKYVCIRNNWRVCEADNHERLNQAQAWVTAAKQYT